MAKKYISDTDRILSVIQYGSITAAAKAMGINQSSLSRTVREFEEEMNTSLFVRTDNGVTLTETGEVCVNYLWKLKKAEEDLKRELAYLESDERNLNIALPFPISRKDTEEMERAVRLKYPSLHIQIMNTRFRNVRQGILSGQYDYAICWDLPDKDDSFTYEKYFDDRLLLLVPDGIAVNTTKMQDGTEYTAAADNLNGMDFVLQNSGTSMRRVIDRIFDKHGISVTVRMTVSDSHLAVKAAEAGIGCALVIESQNTIPDGAAGCQVYVLDESPGETIGLLRLTERELTPAEEYASEVIRRYFLHRKQQVNTGRYHG